MGYQHRTALHEKPTHGRDARIHRLDFQPELIGGILHETSQCRTVADVGGRILQVGRPALGQEALGHGHQSLA
jgi:hypothetical protein